MNFIQTFIQRISGPLQLQRYLLEYNPAIAGTKGLLYAYSPHPYPLIITKVVDHFLFMDWEYGLFSRKEYMVEAYKTFNRHVNKKIKVPHLIRMTIPNMALIIVSESGFDEETLEYARRYMVPWKGGETGQFFLVDLAKKEVIYHQAFQRRLYGSAPLYQAQNILLPIMKKSLPEDSKLP